MLSPNFLAITFILLENPFCTTRFTGLIKLTCEINVSAFLKRISNLRARIREETKLALSANIVKQTGNVKRLTLKNFNLTREKMDFKTSHAWEVYEQIFEKATDTERESLNRYITQLLNNEITLRDFYFLIDGLRKKYLPSERVNRSSIQNFLNAPISRKKYRIRK